MDRVTEAPTQADDHQRQATPAMSPPLPVAATGRADMIGAFLAIAVVGGGIVWIVSKMLKAINLAWRAGRNGIRSLRPPRTSRERLARRVRRVTQR